MRLGKEELQPDLPGDGDHGDAVEEGVGEAGDEVGGSGARGGNADADLARDLSVALRGKDLSLLVPGRVRGRKAEGSGAWGRRLKGV